MKLSDVDKLVDNGNIDESIRYLHAFEFEYKNTPNVAVEIYQRLGKAYKSIYNLDEAERYFLKTLSLEPFDIISLIFLQEIYHITGEFKRNCQMIKKLLRLAPNDSFIISQDGENKIVKGDYKDGFQEYEGNFYGMLQPFPRWAGEDLAGKTILVTHQLGLGDNIQFLRYIDEFTKRGALQVDILSKPELNRLFACLKGVSNVVDEIAMNYNYAISCINMPTILKTKDECDIPRHTFLSVEPADAEIWRLKLAPFKKFKVGLVWHGAYSPLHKYISIPLEQFRPILDVDCDFFSLQKGQNQKDLCGFMAANTINDLMDEVVDLYDTACFIYNLDLVISVDTSIVHLAGGLGKPIWMFNRIGSGWRWLSNRTDSIWYDSVKIYNQTHILEWYSVIKNVAQDLRNYSSQLIKTS
jgi:hypothetical protein